MSALLTTTMGQMKVNIEAFRAAGLFDQLRVMVGGAAVSEDYAATIGAHAHGKDAPASVTKALELLAEVKALRSRGG
jgi:5-methyltetrahydrofolate--homocysteine methyltransferase